MTASSSTSSAAAANATDSSASTSTFIESSSAYHVGKSERNHDNDENDDEDDDEDDDEEKLFAELDRELDMMEDESNFGEHNGDTVASFDMAEFRERRMEELRQEIAAHKSTSDPSTHEHAQHTSTASMKGLLTEITNEKDLIQFSSSERQVAIHFFHPKFERCSLLDRHLTVLARLHPSTLFLKANVLNCPFLTAKLKVSVLPCLITFKDGISKDKMIGFEELGNSDKFSTGALEWRLGQSGIVDPRENRKPIFGFAEQNGGGETVGKGVVGARKEDQDDFWDDE